MYFKTFKIKNYRKFYREKDNFFDVVFTTKSNAESKNFDLIERMSLIVGQNNTGKTTIAKALDSVISKKTLYSTDINYTYLRNIKNKINKKIINNKQIDKNDLPTIEFEIIIGQDELRKKDLKHKFISFINLLETDSDISIKILYQYEEEEDLIAEISENKEEFDQILKRYSLRPKLYNYSNNEIKGVVLEQLIKFKYIEANNIKDDNLLSKSFDKILKFEFKDDTKIDERLKEMNRVLDDKIINDYTIKYSKHLESAIPKSKVGFELKSNITKENVIKSVLKYYYSENDNLIDESNFGLGYTRIILILSEILDYYIKYDLEDVESSVNLIFIEEPESFMHPQLQRVFIRKINNLVNEFLKDDYQNVNSQLAVSTHSPIILNTKIEKTKKLDNINYLYNLDSRSIDLKTITNSNLGIFPNDSESNINFLLKYMKNNLTDLFFADAIILVEGITEKLYIQHLLDNNEYLNTFHISIYIVGGDYSHKYLTLLKSLNIPTSIITDMDIVENEVDSSGFELIKSIVGLKTTNTSLKFFENGTLDEIKETLNKDLDNINYFTQIKKIDSFYATSFEEALILTNIKNKDIMKEFISKVFPQKFPRKLLKIPEDARKVQKSLTGGYKSKFNYELLKIINSDSGKEIKTPAYIEKAIKFIKDKLKERGF